MSLVKITSQSAPTLSHMAAPGPQHQESSSIDATVPPTHTKISSQPTEPRAPTGPSWNGSLSTLANFLKELGSTLSIHDVSLFTFAVDGVLVHNNKIILSAPSNAHLLDKYLSQNEPSWQRPAPIFH